MKLDELARDCQTQPQAAVGARRAGVGLAEALKDMREEAAGNSLAGVLYLDAQRLARAIQSNRALPAGRSEFDGVVNQVPHHLPHPIGIDANISDARR